MMMDSPVMRVVFVTGVWRMSMHRPAWLRRRMRIRGWVRVFAVFVRYLQTSFIQSSLLLLTTELDWLLHNL
jgi:hypothetical protein